MDAESEAEMEPREPAGERPCPLCAGSMSELEEAGCFECSRCGSSSRFRGDDLLAMKIPQYHLRLEEIGRRHAEVLSLIEAEGRKGPERSMTALRSMHEERQRLLSEYSFLSYFGQFVEKW